MSIESFVQYTARFCENCNNLHIESKVRFMFNREDCSHVRILMGE